MEEQIKQLAARLRGLYIVFWAFPMIWVILGETGGDWVGMYANEVRITYYSEAVTILLTAICVPVSLKLFAWGLLRKVNTVTLPEAIRLYGLWSCIRMLLLAVPVWTGFAVYYLMISSTGVLCALIALTSSLFCMPGVKRLRKELHIDKEEEAA